MSGVWAEWNWQPSLWLGLVVLTGGYLGAVNVWRQRFRQPAPVSRGQKAWFLSAAGVLFFALVSPLDALSDQYLFSAHMLQHLLLSLVAPPMLLLGTPGWLLRPLLRLPGVERGLRFLTHPLVAFSVFNLSFAAWHLPVLYEATLQNEAIHIFEHLLFMGTGILNWWPILSPLPELPRLSYPAQIAYLFAEGIPATLLGALIVFSPDILYPTYASAARVINLTPAQDQAAAGLIMWMPGGMIYLLALSLVFRAWYNREQAAGQTKLAP